MSLGDDCISFPIRAYPIIRQYRSIHLRLLKFDATQLYLNPKSLLSSENIFCREASIAVIRILHRVCRLTRSLPLYVDSRSRNNNTNDKGFLQMCIAGSWDVSMFLTSEYFNMLARMDDALPSWRQMSLMYTRPHSWIKATCSTTVVF